MDITEFNRSKRNINRHPWEIARVRVISFLLKRQKKKFEHIADYGSGDAFVLKKLINENIANEYSAIDIAYTPKILSQLKDEIRIIEFYTSQLEFEKKEKKADVILFLDVLEHCENDYKVLNEAVHSHSLDSENNLVLITVPAFQLLFSQHDNLLQHYRRYNRQQVLQLCKEAGLLPVSSGYFFFSLLPLRIGQLIIEKIRRKKNKRSIDNWTGNPFISKSIATLLWLDFRICYTLSNWGIHLPGLSCYCLCTKQQ